MDIKVEVPLKRKCPASLDTCGKIAVLSFGDLDKPDTDVEVEFSLSQLKELQRVVNEGVKNLERSIADIDKRQKDHDNIYFGLDKETHTGSC